MPYAQSAPTAPRSHYDENRMVAWEREKRVRAEAAKRRREREVALEKRSQLERERGENDLAARRVKKLEYVAYLRSEFTSRQKRVARKKPAPSQWEVDRQRAEASKVRAVAARAAEARRRTAAVAAAPRSTRSARVSPAASKASPAAAARRPRKCWEGRHTPANAEERRAARRRAPPPSTFGEGEDDAPPSTLMARGAPAPSTFGRDDVARSSYGDLAAAGYDGTKNAAPWSAVADAAAERLRARISRTNREQMTTRERMEAHMAEMCDSPMSAAVFSAWRVDDAAAAAADDDDDTLDGGAPLPHVRVPAVSPQNATRGDGSGADPWQTTLDHRPSALFASLDLSLTAAQRRDVVERALPPPPQQEARGIAAPGGYGARHAAARAPVPPPLSSASSSRYTAASAPPRHGPRWGGGGAASSAARERELLRKRKADYAERQRERHARERAARARSPREKPPPVDVPPPAPMPCERSPDLTGRRRGNALARRPAARHTRDITASIASVEARDVEKSLRRLEDLLAAKAARKKKAKKKAPPAREPDTPPSTSSPASRSDRGSPHAPDYRPRPDTHFYPGEQPRAYPAHPPPRHSRPGGPDPRVAARRPPAAYHGDSNCMGVLPEDGPEGMVKPTPFAYLLTDPL